MSMSKKYLSICILLILSFVSSFAQKSDFVYYNLQVVVDGEYMVNSQNDLEVSILNTSGDTVYQEIHSALKTSKLALLKIKIGTAVPNPIPKTIPQKMYNFSSIDWSADNYRVKFKFGDKFVRNESKSFLKLTPYVLSSQLATGVDSLESKSEDVIYVGQTVDFQGNLVYNIDELKADSILVSQYIKLPTFPKKKLDKINDLTDGAISLQFESFDRTVLYYKKNEWNRMVIGQDQIQANRGVSGVDTMITTSVGAQTYITNDTNLLAGERVIFSADLVRLGGKIKYESSNPSVVDLSSNIAEPGDPILATLKSYGFSVITAYSVEKPRIKASFYIYIKDSFKKDINKIYSADVYSEHGVFDYAPYDSVVPMAKYRFYAKNVVRPDKKSELSWRVQPIDLAKVVGGFSVDTVDVIFKNSGDFLIQLIESASNEIVGEMNFSVKLPHGVEVDSLGFVQPLLIDSRDGQGYSAMLMPDSNLWMTENLRYLPHVNNLKKPIYVFGYNPRPYGFSKDSTDVAIAKTVNGYNTFGVLYSNLGLGDRTYEEMKNGGNELKVLDNDLQLCPKGWSLPKVDDYMKLNEKFMESGVGGYDDFYKAMNFDQSMGAKYDTNIPGFTLLNGFQEFLTSSPAIGTFTDFFFYIVKVNAALIEKSKDFDSDYTNETISTIGRPVRCMKRLDW